MLEQEKSEIDQYNTSINIKKENIQKAKDDIQIFKKNINDLYDNIDSNKKAKDVAQKLLINYIEAKMQFATKHLKNVNIKYYTILKQIVEKLNRILLLHAKATISKIYPGRKLLLLHWKLAIC